MHTSVPLSGNSYACHPQDLKEWLTWLRQDVGFDGWRFDFVKGYRGERVREYVEATQPDIVVGEYWDACGYEGEHGDQLCANQVRLQLQCVSRWAAVGHVVRVVLGPGMGPKLTLGWLRAWSGRRLFLHAHREHVVGMY